MLLATINGEPVVFRFTERAAHLKDKNIKVHFNDLQDDTAWVVAGRIAAFLPGRPSVYTRFSHLENKTLGEVFDNIKVPQKQLDHFLKALSGLGIVLANPVFSASKKAAREVVAYSSPKPKERVDRDGNLLIVRQWRPDGPCA